MYGICQYVEFFSWSIVELKNHKGPSSQGYGFSCGHVWMWELNCE